jgi:hypothetical protein
MNLIAATARGPSVGSSGWTAHPEHNLIMMTQVQRSNKPRHLREDGPASKLPPGGALASSQADGDGHWNHSPHKARPPHLAQWPLPRPKRDRD